jgi:multisubunit Na+/H+ antiporter MnhE subunit
MNMVGKAWAMLVLLLRFLKAVVLSGWQTVKVILATTPGGAPARTGTFVRVRFAPMNATGAAILGCMVSLTPGTTTLDIDMDLHELLLHVLDETAVQEMLEGIRTEFEPGLVAVFGADR